MTDDEFTRGRRPATPTWVKALAIAAAVMVLVVVAVMLLAGGEHGPGRHAGGRPAVAVARDSPLTDGPTFPSTR